MSKKTRARSQVRIPDDWDGEKWAPVFFCVPDSELWKAAVSGALSTVMRGRLWDGDTGTVTEAQEIGTQIWESMDMDCSDVFAGIEAAIRDISLDQGCCPADVTTEPPVDQPPIDTIIDFTEGPIPGWPDQLSWDLGGCQAAQLFWDDMLTVLVEIENYGSLGTGIGGIAITAITALVSLPWTIAVGSVAAVTFLLTDFSLRVTRQEWEALKQDFVCAIHNSDRVTAAKSAVDQVIDDNISNSVSRTLLKSWVTVNWLNRLYEGNWAAVDLSKYDEFFCSGCPAAGQCGLEFISPQQDGSGIGTGDLTIDGSVRTLTATQANNGFWYTDFSTLGTCPCGDGNITIEVVAVTLGPGEGAGYRIEFQEDDCSETVVITSFGDQDPIPLGEYVGYNFEQVGDVAFTIDVRLTALP